MRQLVQQCTKFNYCLRSFQRLQAAISDEDFVIPKVISILAAYKKASVLSQQIEVVFLDC